MQFPTSNPQLHWPEPFPQPSACRIREGVKLVIFLWRSKKCINQTFIFETKFSGIKGQGSFLEEFHPKSHHQKSTKTNHQFRGWKQKLPPQKKGHELDRALPTVPNLSRSPTTSKRHVGKGRFWVKSWVLKEVAKPLTQKVQVIFVGHHPPKKKKPTNLNQQKKLDVFCESP